MKHQGSGRASSPFPIPIPSEGCSFSWSKGEERTEAQQTLQERPHGKGYRSKKRRLIGSIWKPCFVPLHAYKGSHGRLVLKTNKTRTHITNIKEDLEKSAIKGSLSMCEVALFLRMTHWETYTTKGHKVSNILSNGSEKKCVSVWMCVYRDVSENKCVNVCGYILIRMEREL